MSNLKLRDIKELKVVLKKIAELEHSKIEYVLSNLLLMNEKYDLKINREELKIIIKHYIEKEGFYLSQNRTFKKRK